LKIIGTNAILIESSHIAEFYGERAVYVLVALAVLGIAGEPALEQFEWWTPPEPGLAAGEVRVIGSYPTRLLRGSGGIQEYYVLDEPPQMAFAAWGPATVMLRVIGAEERLVNIGLDLDADLMAEETILVSSKRPAELFLSVPEGRHLVAVSASSGIMIFPQSVDRALRPDDRVVGWGGREKGGEPVKAGSSFWKYKPDLSKFEFKEEGPPRRWSFWVNAGLGPSVNVGSSSSGLGFGGSANFRIDHYLVQIRSTYNMEMSFMGPQPQESLWEVSPMFGFVLKGKVGWISAGAGVGLVGGTKRGRLIEHGGESSPDKYAEDDYLNVGFPLDVQFFLKPPSFLMFGLGLNVYANLGPDNSVVGLMLSIMAGG
jgi:hypothetical protein